MQEAISVVISAISEPVVVAIKFKRRLEATDAFLIQSELTLITLDRTDNRHAEILVFYILLFYS